MKAKSIIVAMVLIIFFIGCKAQHKKKEAGSPELKKTIENFVKSVIDEFQIPGLAFSIVMDNTIYESKVFGVSNIETMQPLTSESIFHMASISKTFMATAIIQLVEEGKINIDEPLVNYLPYFRLNDSLYMTITIKQILTHTSGFPDVDDYEWDKPQFDDGSAERYVRSISNKKMIAKPGDRYEYSNMSFDVLADLILKVSGKTFEDYVRENILDPIGMVESDFILDSINQDNRISGHEGILIPSVVDQYPYNRSHAASSCLNSNIIEMSNWAIVNINKGKINNHRILSRTSYDIMFKPLVNIPEGDYENADSIGLSWFIKNFKGNKVFYHGGGDIGFRSYIAIIPEKSIGVVIASNYGGTPNREVAFGILDIMLGFEPQMPKIPIQKIMLNHILERNVSVAIEEYYALKINGTQQYLFGEWMLNSLGYYLLNINRVNDAITIFSLNVKEFPDYANGYDSLGEAYMKTGQTELAIKNYEKSLELNPDNENAQKMLDKLKN